MDMLYGFALVGILVVGGVWALFYSLNQRYPPVKVMVWNRGVRQGITYRQVGTSLVKDNLVKVLMNEYEYVGDLRYLEYDLAKSSSLFGLRQSVGKVYRAYMRADYLFGLKGKKENELEIQKSRPLLIGDKGLKVSISPEGILVPFTMQLTNNELVEEEIHTGKEIAQRFVLNKKSTQAFINAQNPVMAIIISAIPMLIMVGLSAIVIYLGFSGLGDAYQSYLQLQGCQGAV